MSMKRTRITGSRKQWGAPADPRADWRWASHDDENDNETNNTDGGLRKLEPTAARRKPAAAGGSARRPKRVTRTKKLVGSASKATAPKRSPEFAIA